MRGFGLSRKYTSKTTIFLTIFSLFSSFKNQMTRNYDLLGTISRANIHTSLSSLSLTRSHFLTFTFSTSLLSLFNTKKTYCDTSLICPDIFLLFINDDSMLQFNFQHEVDSSFKVWSTHTRF